MGAVCRFACKLFIMAHFLARSLLLPTSNSHSVVKKDAIVANHPGPGCLS